MCVLGVHQCTQRSMISDNNFNERGIFLYYASHQQLGTNLMVVYKVPYKVHKVRKVHKIFQPDSGPLFLVRY